ACPPPCSCGKWKSGKETTDCIRSDFTRIPEGLPVTTQVLDLLGNNLDILYNYTFLNKSLVNLQRLFMVECSITDIQPAAFAQLSNLIELDLSNNKLKNIPGEAFVGTPALRQLNLRGNEISFIPGDAFTHTPSIVSLDVSHCEVIRVAPEAFQALSMLESLKLQQNKLKELPRKMIDGLAAVHNLEVHGNLWICDCRVLPLWRLLIRLRVSHPITPACHVPTALQGSKFDTLAEKDLACPPEILPGSRFVEGFEGENTSVACRVWGEPAPRVQWYIDNKEITNLDHGRLVSLVKHKGDGDTVSNLLISETRETD
ncbi:Leucine-rich repeat, partial [Trinorchestia longiramus]